MEEILHQLRLVVYPNIFTRFLYIPGGAGFLPSTVCWFSARVKKKYAANGTQKTITPTTT